MGSASTDSRNMHLEARKRDKTMANCSDYYGLHVC